MGTTTAAAVVGDLERGSRLAGMTEAQRRLYMGNATALTRGDCYGLISGAREEVSPQVGMGLAEDAVALAAALSAPDLLCEAATELANHLRRLGELEAASRWVRKARTVLASHAVDPLARARVYRIAASVADNRQQHQQARRYARRALFAYQDIGQVLDEAAMWIKLSGITAEGGRPERGLVEAERGRRLAMAHDDLPLALGAINNMAYCLVEMRTDVAVGQAAILLANAADLYDRVGTPLQQADFTWLRARIAQYKGDVTTAACLFRSAFEDFAIIGQRQERLIVGIRLAECLNRQGRWWEAAKLLPELLELSAGAGQAAETVSAALKAAMMAEAGVQADALRVALLSARARLRWGQATT